jgi:hypothetical protein
MGIPSRIIAIKSLMKRWGMSRFDILLMALNHGLVPVLRAGSGWEYIGYDSEEADILELFLGSEKDMRNIIFLTADVHGLENKFGGKIKKSDEIITESELMKRWSINEGIELFDIEDNLKLVFVDPLSIPLNDFQSTSSRGFFYSYEGSYIVDFYFNRSEIEKVEQGSGIKPQSAIKKPKRGRLSNIHKERCRAAAKKLWDTDPKITIEEMAIRDEINELFDKKVYNSKTIRNWIKDLCPNRLPGRRPK